MSHLSVELAKDIDATIGTIATCPTGEGHVLMKILKGGGVSVIEMMIRKFRPQKKHPSC